MMGVIVMETVLTNEKDERFLELVRELDRGYYERIGDELSKYDQYNEFTKPHVVLLAQKERNCILSHHRIGKTGNER